MVLWSNGMTSRCGEKRNIAIRTGKEEPPSRDNPGSTPGSATRILLLFKSLFFLPFRCLFAFLANHAKDNPLVKCCLAPVDRHHVTLSSAQAFSSLAE